MLRKCSRTGSAPHDRIGCSSTDKATRVLAGTDFITRRGVPAAVVRPTSIDQVVALLGYAAEHGVRIVPRGAATNLCAGHCTR